MNITDHLLKFRETIMKIWNETYYPVIRETGGDFDLEHNFCEVEKKLFEVLVLRYLNNDYDASDLIESHMKKPGRALERFHIIPARNNTRIDVNREFHSGYWDYPINEVQKKNAVINFVHFFDWASLDCERKYEFYLGRIKFCENGDQLIGKDVLIPVSESKIQYIIE